MSTDLTKVVEGAKGARGRISYHGQGGWGLSDASLKGSM